MKGEIRLLYPLREACTGDWAVVDDVVVVVVDDSSSTTMSHRVCVSDAVCLSRLIGCDFS